MRKDLRESPEYAAVAEHLRRLHEPAFGRPHRVADLVTTTDGSRIVVTGSVYDELDGLPRTALYEVRDGALHALTSGGGSAKAARLAPDGSSLAFLSDRAKAEVFQLYLLAEGQLGEARADRKARDDPSGASRPALADPLPEVSAYNAPSRTSYSAVRGSPSSSS